MRFARVPAPFPENQRIKRSSPPTCHYSQVIKLATLGRKTVKGKKWQMSAYVGDNIITAVAMYQGLWMSCAFQSTGQMQCKVYDSILQLDSSLQATRALMIVSIIVSVVGLGVACMGMKCTNCGGDDKTKKSRIAMTGGVILLVGALSAIVACSWFAHKIIKAFYDPFTPVNTKYEFGSAIFIAWAGSFLDVLGGGMLAASCPRKESVSKYPIASSRPPSSTKDGTPLPHPVELTLDPEPEESHLQSNNTAVSSCTEAITMTTTFVIEQPKPVIDVAQSNQWSSGICDCWDDKAECCFAFWCCPCFACKISRAYDQCLCLPLLDIFGIVPGATLPMRVSMRQHYGINGTICNDCLYTTFCKPCSWCQMSREMKKRLQPIVLLNAKMKE
ncbi:hypothetical protein AAFF_G00247530 [Aldrovandia affinis]|uniref:Claudin n=1 Tax=Aldrovandia affinis TaxID=143900 RepID=A0AAD7SUB3_9TELE|nr:hypothetical protein AAFF_G00247530 [Aldrovandia affinis]